MEKRILIVLLFILGFNFTCNCSFAEEPSNTSNNTKFPPFSKTNERIFKRQLERYPNNYSILKELGNLYCDREDFSNAEIYYIKAINVNMNEQDVNKLGLIFYLQDDYSNAIKCFKIALKLNPNNEKTKRKIAFIESQIPQIQELKKICSLEPRYKAPKQIHELVIVEGKLKDINDEKKLHKIIDFMWSDPEGRFLLQTVINMQVPIRLKKNISTSQFGYVQTAPNDNAINYTENPKLSPIYFSNTEKFLYIKEKDISDFQDPDSNIIQNMKPIATIAHELCHMLMFSKYQKIQNSQEEEFISAIIGLNIASRILTNSPLTEEQVQQFGSMAYNLVLKSRMNSYHYLERRSEYAETMKEIGFILPYYEIYSNLDNLRYKEKKNNVVVKDYIKTIKQNDSLGYDSIYTNKYSFNYYYINISRNGIITLFENPNPKCSKKFDKETMFNLNVAIYSKPFPNEYKDSLIPLTLYRNDKHVRISY